MNKNSCLNRYKKSKIIVLGVDPQMWMQELEDLTHTTKESLLSDLTHTDKTLGYPYVCLLDQCATDFYKGVHKSGSHRLVLFESCIKKSKILLDLTWEQLNTGYWKDVDLKWRYAYTVASFVKCLSEMYVFMDFTDSCRRRVIDCDIRNSDDQYATPEAHSESPEYGQNEALKVEFDISKYCRGSNYKDLLNDLRDKFMNVMKTVDLGILMGAPVLDNILARTAKIIQRIYASVVDQLENVWEGFPLKINEDRNDDCESGDILNTRSVDDKNNDTEIKRVKLSDTAIINTGTQLYVEITTATVSDCDALVRIYGDKKLSKNRLITRISCPSMENFRCNFMLPGKSVVITDAVDYWPAFTTRKWSLDYIKAVAGLRTVPIEVGSKYTDESWSQTLMTISDFIDKHILYCDRKTKDPSEVCMSNNSLDSRGGDPLSIDNASSSGHINKLSDEGKKHPPVGYLAQYQLFDQIPELQDDIDIPTYCCHGESEDVDINAWFGPKGTVSPLHYDPKHNFLVQVVGSKYIRVYPEHESGKLYPHDNHMLFNTSQVDLLSPDLDSYPDFVDAVYTECILNPGDMLYIPPKHWHYVESLSTSFSVSFWWQ